MMLSLQTVNFFPDSKGKDPSRKRKRCGGLDVDGVPEFAAAAAGDGMAKKWKLWCDDQEAETAAPVSDTDVQLHLEDKPLPPEWQRCLDIKSGRIHYYNTRTHTRTSRDPRRSSDPPSARPPAGLNLELNLSCESPVTRGGGSEDEGEVEQLQKRRHGGGGLSWVSLESDCKEMVAAVCVRCHMLVMMCSSSPSCPNCKFAPPTSPDHRDRDPSSPSPLTKPWSRLLLSCKD